MQAAQAVSPRTAVTAPDADISTLPRYPCEGAAVVRLGALCDTPGAKLTCRVVFWDGVSVLIGNTATVTFTAEAKASDGKLCIATPDIDAWFPVGGPSMFAVHVDSVSAGTWTINPMAQ